MTSYHSKMSSHSTAVKTKHVPLTAPQRLEIIGRLESGKSQSVVLTSCNTGSSTVYDVQNEQDQL